MAPSWVSTSISMFLKSQKAFLLALEPLRQISADLSKAKDVLALIQEIVYNNNNNKNKKSWKSSKALGNKYDLRYNNKKSLYDYLL